ncbi:MAG: molybdopterin molybdenumtransferase MoeA, partial [Acetobacteraceae bacterium]|nr:molybdopterin molybdenumtransferase MoeA [Acetobacteraceae bacterium]
LSIDAALRRIAQDIRCVARSEWAPLHASDGRILAENVTAPVDLPPFDNSNE